MAMYAHLVVAALTVALPAAAVADATTTQGVSEPGDGYLHAVVQAWTEKSPVGSLRAMTLPENDVELRIWTGFNALGTWAHVLRRRNGEWTVSAIHIDRYYAGASNAIAAREGILPPCIVDEMKSRCVVETTYDAQDRPLDYVLECAQEEQPGQPDDQAEMAGLWDSLIALGLLSLPPTIERKRDWVSTGGHFYVIEVRTGNRYRATVTEYAGDSPIDAKIHRILRAFDDALGTDTLYRGYER